MSTVVRCCVIGYYVSSIKDKYRLLLLVHRLDVDVNVLILYNKSIISDTPLYVADFYKKTVIPIPFVDDIDVCVNKRDKYYTTKELPTVNNTRTLFGSVDNSGANKTDERYI